MPRRPLLPPHIAWPGAITGLLLLSLGYGVAVVVAANSDGGAQVVEGASAPVSPGDAAAAIRSAALGWTLTARAAPSVGAARTVRVTVTDADGAPVTGLTGTATVSRPQRAAVLATRAVVPERGANGVYRVAVPDAGPGLYDLAADLRRADGARVLDRVRVTLR